MGLPPLLSFRVQGDVINISAKTPAWFPISSDFPIVSIRRYHSTGTQKQQLELLGNTFAMDN